MGWLTRLYHNIGLTSGFCSRLYYGESDKRGLIEVATGMSSGVAAMHPRLKRD
jgi:hypothetical protein